MSYSQALDGFSITHILPAHLEAAWDAWLDPETMIEWLATRNTVILVEEIQTDPQAGSHYRYATANVKSGECVVTGGIFQELEVPQRLAFTWGNHRAAPEDAPLVVVTLEPPGDDTLLFFELRGASGPPGDRFFYDRWATALSAFEQYLIRTRTDD